MGMDPVGVVDELRRRLSTFIKGGYYPADVALRLSALETRHSAGGSTNPAPAISGSETITRSSTFIVTNDSGNDPTEGHSATMNSHNFVCPDIQDRTYDRIRKWKLEFTGKTDPIDFIERIEELARSQRIPLDEVPATLSECLQDSALAWWRNRRHEWSGWATFRAGFLRYFLPTNFWEDLDDSIRARRQRETEPFKDYALALETLMRHTQYDTLQKLERIYKNSLPAIKLLIKRKEFESLDELTALVAHVEITRGGVSPLTPFTLREVDENLGTKPRSVAKPSGYRPPSGTSRPDGPPKPRTTEGAPPTKITNPQEACRRCARHGHIAARCQNPVQLFCWNCGKTNVRTKDCCPPQTTQVNVIHTNLETPPEVEFVLKISEPFYTGRSFKCNISAGGRTYSAIVDTGSWHSYVNDDVCRELPVQAYNREPCHFDVIFADGTKGRVSSALTIKYEFRSKVLQGRVLILKGSMDPFILGMDFLAHVGVRLCFGNGDEITSSGTPLLLTELQHRPGSESSEQPALETLMSEQPGRESELSVIPTPETLLSQQPRRESEASGFKFPDIRTSQQDRPESESFEQQVPNTLSSEQPWRESESSVIPTPETLLSQQPGRESVSSVIFTPETPISQQPRRRSKSSESPTSETRTLQQYQPESPPSEQRAPDPPTSEQCSQGTTSSEEDTSAEGPHIPDHITTFLQDEVAKFAEIRGVARVGMHRLFMKDEIPIKQRYYPRNPAQQEIINEKVDELLQKDCIEPSNSPYSAPVVLVRKKNNQWRMCIDYRQLNAKSITDAYPLPRIHHILDRLRNARFISSLDLKDGYWQIAMEPESRKYTAFTVPGRGLFQWKVMPFGLHSAPATFQRTLDGVIGIDLEPNVFAYLDDIIVHNASLAEHVETLQEVFRRLREANLRINPEKCDFFKKRTKYLGHVISEEGIHTDPEKIQAIQALQAPTNVRELRRVLGNAPWYRRFVPDFSTVALPMTDLLKKGKHFKWGLEQQCSFDQLKQHLTQAPVLACPDFGVTFKLQTDASEVGLARTTTQSAQLVRRRRVSREL